MISPGSPGPLRGEPTPSPRGDPGQTRRAQRRRGGPAVGHHQATTASISRCWSRRASWCGRRSQNRARSAPGHLQDEWRDRGGSRWWLSLVRASSPPWSMARCAVLPAPSKPPGWPRMLSLSNGRGHWSACPAALRRPGSSSLLDQLGFEPEAGGRVVGAGAVPSPLPLPRPVATDHQAVVCWRTSASSRGRSRNSGLSAEGTTLEPFVAPSLCVTRLAS